MNVRWLIVCRAGRRCADVRPTGDEARWPVGLRLYFTCGTCGTNYVFRNGRRVNVSRRSLLERATFSYAYFGIGFSAVALVALALGHGYVFRWTSSPRRPRTVVALILLLLWRRRLRRARG